MLGKRSKAFYEIQKRFRAKRFLRIERIIRTLTSKTGQTQILDVGGTAEYWRLLAPDLRSQVEVTLVNFESELRLYEVEIEGLEIRHHVGDACDLSEFDDGSYDLVHSNSVIEHVRSYENMLRFASEVRRLGRSYLCRRPTSGFRSVRISAVRSCIGFRAGPDRVVPADRHLAAPKADFETAIARCDDIKIIDAGMMRQDSFRTADSSGNASCCSQSR